MPALVKRRLRTIADLNTTVLAPPDTVRTCPSCVGPAFLGALAILALTLSTRASPPVCIKRTVIRKTRQRTKRFDADEGSWFRRKITNSTSLRYMHVTHDMVDCLHLRNMGQDTSDDAVHGGRFLSASVETCADPPTPPGRINHKGQEQRSLTSTPSASKDFRGVFQRLLTLRDSAGLDWPVLYEATVSCGQYHRRFSHGWGDFCRRSGVQMGDTVEFSRRLALNGHTLAVRVLKRRKKRA